MSLKHSWSLILVLVLAGCCGKSVKYPPIQGNIYIPTETYIGKFTDHPSDPMAHRSIFPIAIDSSFSIADRKQILSAISEINKVFNNYLVLVVVSDTTGLSQYGIVIEKADLPENILGLADGGVPGHHVQIDSDKLDLLKEDITMVVVHELFHSFGLSHIEIKNSIMYPSVDFQPICINEVSVDHLVSILNMKKKYMNWCVIESD